MKLMTPTEGAKADILKAVRAAVRLKHSLRADAELRKVMPEVEAQVDRAISDGRMLELNPAD